MQFVGQIINIDGISIEVIRKAMKTIRFTVYPPDGRVRVSVPKRLSERAVRAAITEKLDWIFAKRAELALRPRRLDFSFITGEEHFFLGRKHRLLINFSCSDLGVLLEGDRIVMRVLPRMNFIDRRDLLSDWYRSELRLVLPSITAKWEAITGLQASYYGIRSMKTRWGSCNPHARRIWLNLDLIQKPRACLEYVVLHELVHFWISNHGADFTRRMDYFMPGWRRHRAVLNDELCDF